MTRVDVFSGFLGAGKTTLIRKLLKEALAGSKVVLIENEFGEIGIDGGFLKESGIEIREMNSGCICCSLVGDFGTSLKEVMAQYAPERILIEPSGVGKLSDVIQAVRDAAEGTEMEMGSAVTVVDASKAKMYLKNFGEFFTDQIAAAATVILTRVDKCDEQKLATAVELIRGLNEKATIVTTKLDELDGRQLLTAIEGKDDLQAALMAEVIAAQAAAEECCCHYHDDEEHEHHHHHDDDDECCCHHHDDEHEHHHHHHDHDDHVEAVIDEDGNRIYSSAEHEHHQHHHHHGGHDADEIFQSLGIETAAKFTKDRLEKILSALDDEDTYGFILRAKGMLPTPDGTWLHYDYVPGECEIREGSAEVTGKICVIGAGLREDELKKLFLER